MEGGGVRLERLRWAAALSYDVFGSGCKRTEEVVGSKSGLGEGGRTGLLDPAIKGKRTLRVWLLRCDCRDTKRQVQSMGPSSVRPGEAEGEGPRRGIRKD